MLTPRTEAEVVEAVREAAAAATPLEVRGGGTRSGLGRPVQAAKTLSTGGVAGISLYEPAALTIVAAAGTPLGEIEAALAAEGQRLPFEPPDHGALYAAEGEATLGGAVATGASGPRRVTSGACRDALLGLRFVTGEGDAVKSGGRVMKNVTGYDLAKLLCGSHGTLGVITEVAVKLEPLPESELTLAFPGLADGPAVALMSAALGSPYTVTGAAHLTAETAPEGTPLTLLRVEGMATQAAYRAERLTALLAEHGEPRRVEGAAHRALWSRVRDLGAFVDRQGAVWRLSLVPSQAATAVATIARTRALAAQYDWGGGLVTLCVSEEGDAGASAIRQVTAAAGGHATLLRAPEPMRAAVPVFEPEPEPLAAIGRGLRARFDPKGILNPGRMGV